MFAVEMLGISDFILTRRSIRAINAFQCLVIYVITLKKFKFKAFSVLNLCEKILLVSKLQEDGPVLRHL